MSLQLRISLRSNLKASKSNYCSKMANAVQEKHKETSEEKQKPIKTTNKSDDENRADKPAKEAGTDDIDPETKKLVLIAGAIGSFVMVVVPFLGEYIAHRKEASVTKKASKFER